MQFKPVLFKGQLYTHTLIHSAIKKKKILPFVTTQMDLEAIMFSEMTQRKTSTAQTHLHMESKKKSQTHRYREQIWWLPVVGFGGGRNSQKGVKNCKLPV